MKAVYDILPIFDLNTFNTFGNQLYKSSCFSQTSGASQFVRGVLAYFQIKHFFSTVQSG